MYVKEKNLGQPGRLEFKILAPSRNDVPNSITHEVSNSRQHSELMYDLQKLRGDVYREYAGIASTLLPDGRHWHRLDASSWHVILHDETGEVYGCARYRKITTFDELICSKAAVALSPTTGPIFRATFTQHVAEARRRGLHYGEASAWALSEKARCSTAAVNIALMSFALAEWLGAAGGITTASTRHHASSILKRIGGKRFANFEPYYEPMFDCNIELLDLNLTNMESRYSVKLDEMRAQLRGTSILCPLEGYQETHLSQELPYVPTANRTSHQPVIALQ
jgi:hypothetical protein